MKINTTADISQIKEQGQQLLFPGKPRINVGTSTCCIAKGADLTLNALQYAVKEQALDADIVSVGCLGLCSMEPTVEVQLPGKPAVIYGNVTDAQVPALLDAVKNNTVAADLAIVRIDAADHCLAGTITFGTADAAFTAVPAWDDIDYLNAQRRLVLRNTGAINPESLAEYIARDGYGALAKALSRQPGQIIDDMIASGLRGRGGGGFPAGQKWRMCSEAAGDTKYLICNVSEGEPGIGMHRSFMESDPHSVLEGLIIGGYAIGAQTAYVYIRDNYRIALSRFRKAIADAEDAGLLGDNIMGSGFGFSVVVKEGGGRYVCGEETALIACLEGRVGEPRQRPPFPTQAGLFGKPTCINNVETWANVPLIVSKGGAWYAGLGTSGSTGTKVLSLSGNIARSGMVEVEMGITLQEVIDTVGGGVADGKQLKGFQPGGPSGGVLPAQSASLKVDYDELKNAGSMLGSGGMVVMDEDTDMVKMTRYFLDFFVEESCGKCAPCREGVCRLRDIYDNLLAGHGSAADLEAIKAIADPMTKACACALGKTAPVPATMTIEHFAADYQRYI